MTLFVLVTSLLLTQANAAHLVVNTGPSGGVFYFNSRANLNRHQCRDVEQMVPQQPYAVTAFVDELHALHACHIRPCGGSCRTGFADRGCLHPPFVFPGRWVSISPLIVMSFDIICFPVENNATGDLP